MVWDINTNTASLYAQQGLSTAQSQLATTIQSLSTGMRVNNASQDPAGWAINIRMTSDINGMNQAVRNSNDGISLVQTGQSALTNITNALQTMRTLAVQASTGTYSSTDLANLNSEFSALASEIDNIASSTSFNGNKIFGGSAVSIQVGADTQATSTLAITTAALNNIGSLSGGPFASTNTTMLTTGSPALANADADLTATIVAAGGQAPSKATLNTFNTSVVGAANTAYTTAWAAVIGAGGTASSAAVSANATAATAFGSAAAVAFSVAGTASGLTAAQSSTAATGAQFSAGITAISTNASAASVSNATVAAAALAAIDTQLSTLSSQQAQLGAFQIQLTTQVSNLQANVTNTSSAQGQIVDVDYASTTAQLSRLQILQNASTAMLAQANQSNSGVMQLLR
ncbi:flagellin [Candidatus Methylospira mobilis]|uniref:Flagellin n=1 Tax=Candidatus Methylospira mobilis TaxID=1808979 RepID=A0A5Q0BDB2_9GAMM|nr:flagellin [Candidatus Methylospira mobilis]QFY41883.1 flagellin [Candidatus Methylospira mobilis]